MISSASDPIDRAATLGQVDLVLDAIGVQDASRAPVQVIARRAPTAVLLGALLFVFGQTYQTGA